MPGCTLLARAALGLLAPVATIDRLCRITADLTGAENFYCASLGFRRAGRFRETLPPGDASLLVLGPSRLQLTQCDTPGAPHDAGRADDPSFQHAAIVVADVDVAWAQIAAARPISLSGPVLLPGGVRAVKFRDPDGHPLELLQFPAGEGRAQWRQAPGLFRGIDHSAITVRDTTASLVFWRDALGLAVSSHSINLGAPQHSLDGVPDPLVRVTQLRPHRRDSMRIELLAYLAPPRRRRRAAHAPNDIAADRLVVKIHDLDQVFAKLVRANASFITGRPVSYEDGRAFLLADPDGHHLLCQAA